MAPYLPRDGAAGGSPYSEGGALFALGLIHANHGQDIRQFLLDSLRNTGNEVSPPPPLFLSNQYDLDTANQSLSSLPRCETDNLRVGDMPTLPYRSFRPTGKALTCCMTDAHLMFVKAQNWPPVVHRPECGWPREKTAIP